MSSSVEFVVDELSFFSSYPYQITITENTLVPSTPINSIDQTSNVEFYLPAANSVYRNLSEIYIHVSAQVLKSDSSLYTEADKPQGTLASNFIGNLFKDVKVLLNNVQVYSCDHDFAIVQFIENCSNYDVQSASHKMIAGGIFPYNDIKNLQNHTKNSIVRDYYARLPLVNLNKFIIPGVSVTLRFSLNDEAYYIMEMPDDETKPLDSRVFSNSKVKIHGITLYNRQYQLRDDFNLWAEQRLTEGLNANYEFFSSKLNTVSVPTGTISYNIGSLFTGPKPSIMIFSLIENSRYIGKRNLDPHVFKDHGLIEFSFLFNGKQCAQNTWSMSNSKTEVKLAHLFYQFHSTINLGHDNGSTLVTYENFCNGQFFIAQDNKAFPSGISDLREISEKVQIGCNLRFKEALIEPLIAVLYVYNQRKIEISGDRVVSVIE